jgi:hypothetical protein
MISKGKVPIRICIVADIFLFGISVLIGFWTRDWKVPLVVAVFGILIFNLTVRDRAKNRDRSLNVLLGKFEKWLNNNGS